ncbi:alpha/beta fold hydrolase [Corynebacterium sp.]|uniref:alpha/beta fold hydrolase n=1 Tax=Corynebacterium sp. TaxID=1720 RepID=UPI002A9153D4|nr:alpha/beta fold hydrolase [Corynebacterium sp.]MDY5784853.1 alpha/beta fold hydrolase [Corynebacterium sp.]
MGLLGSGRTVELEREGVRIFARVLGDDPAPALLFLQGGPGFPSPRERFEWIGEALKHYRVVLLDQRGTGNSTRVDRATPELIDATFLTQLRADAIVADAEAVRAELGIAQWDVLGQSFGGFCLAHYLARHPGAVRNAFFTGGLPTSTRGIDEVYAATFAKLKARHLRFYAEVPFAEQRIRDICRHLDGSEEVLPTGERLSSRRFRTIGVNLGREGGFDSLAALLEQPFHSNGRLRTDFLAEVGAQVSFETAPLYAAIHEPIYAGTVPGATNWSAERVSETLAGFARGASPDDEEFYLTGEHIFPFQFDEDPALRPFKQAAEALAAKDDWANLYAGLGRVDNAYAVVYTDDIFVPRELSLETAGILGARVHETSAWQHDGLRRYGAEVIGVLTAMAGIG